MKNLSDADFIQELKTGPLGRDFAATREADRLKRAKTLAKQRSDEEKRFVAEFPKLQSAEEKALVAFHEAAQRFEDAKRQADQAYFARTNAQAEVDKRLGAIAGEIMRSANPLYRELCAKLSAICDDARKITGFVEKKRDDPSKPDTGLKVYTNRAARHARMFLPTRIVNALSDLVLAGLDSDENLNAIYGAGIAALPHEETLRLEDGIPSQFSPRFEAAVEAFSEAIDAALKTAMKDTK
jgi:hypothetical protein